MPLSPHAPRIVSVKIPADRIGELIGAGGKNIKGTQAASGAEINIEDDCAGVSKRIHNQSSVFCRAGFFFAGVG